MAEAAVVMQVKLPEGVLPEDDLAILNDFVVPLAKAQAGFKNGTWARDGKGFYASSEHSTDPRYVMATMTELYWFDLASAAPYRIS